MIYDTNLLIKHIHKRSLPPALAIIVVGELEAFSLKADWGAQKGYYTLLCSNRRIQPG